MSNEDEFKRPELSRKFKLGIIIISGIVVLCLIVFLIYVSMQGCGAIFLNFPMRSSDCDVSNVLAMSIELTVAGIFAIIVGVIFYEKQKGDTELIIKLARKQLKQQNELQTVDQRIDEVEFNDERLKGIRIMVRNFNEIQQVLQRIQGTDKSGPFRNVQDIVKRDELIEKIEKVIDTTSFSKDPEYNLVESVESLLNEIKKTPSPEQILRTSAGKFAVNGKPNFTNLISKISSMESTLGGIRRTIIDNEKKKRTES